MSNLLGIYDSKKSMIGLIKINADTYNEIPSQDILYLNGLTSNVQQQINTINTGISNGKRKQLRPGSVEIYLSFFDSNTNESSIIPNYKIIVTKYGDNEVFKLIRGGLVSNNTTP